MKESKRYNISYTSGATGYGWDEPTNSRKEAASVAKSLGKNYTAYVSVWDNKLNNFIYLKRVLEYKPEIDTLT